MKYIYIPSTHFPFYIILQIQSTPIPTVELLQFQSILEDVPLLSEHFPFLHQHFNDYFLKKSTLLDIPHKLIAKTAFQQRVLTALREIPFGKSVTYGDMAEKLGTHPRAIGQALKSNPLPLVYPCHRVLSKIGLGGFMGQAKGSSCDIKQALVQFEQPQLTIHA